MVLYRSPETCIIANKANGQYWHSETEKKLKIFLVGGRFVQLQLGKNMLLTITVCRYLRSNKELEVI